MTTEDDDQEDGEIDWESLSESLSDVEFRQFLFELINNNQVREGFYRVVPAKSGAHGLAEERHGAVLETALEECPSEGVVELLSFPGTSALGGHRENLVGIHHRNIEGAWHSELPVGDTKGGSYVTETWTRLEESLGDRFELERCTLHLGNISYIPVRTSRLLLKTDTFPPLPQIVAGNPIADLLAMLEGADIAYIYQVLLNPNGEDEALATVRLAVFGDKTISLDGSQMDLSRVVTAEKPIDINAAFDGYGYGEKLRPKGYHVDRFDVFMLGKADVDHDEIFDLITGPGEFRRLLKAAMDKPSTYIDQGLEPRFPIQTGQLKLLGPCEMTATGDPWQDISGVNAPRITDVEGGHTPDETLLPDTSSGLSPGMQHEQLVQEVHQYLNSVGYQVHVVDQDGDHEADSLPDLVGYDPDGEPLHVEVEVRNSPSGTLRNAERALAAGVNVMFVTAGPLSDDAHTMKTIADRLADPFHDRDIGEKPRFYNEKATTISVETEAGTATLLLPTSGTESRWHPLPDGRVELATNAPGGSLAKGGLETPFNQFEYRTPRFVATDDGYVVLDANGSERATYSTRSALSDEWTLVHPPHIPKRLGYLGGWVKFRRWNNNELEPWRRSHPAEKFDAPMDRYRSAMESFFQSFLYQAEGAEIDNETCNEQFSRFYRELTGQSGPQPNIFGQVRSPNGFGYPNIRRPTAGGPLEGLDWVLPPQLDSPNVHEFDAEDLKALLDHYVGGDASR